MDPKYVQIGEIKYSQFGEKDLRAVALGSCVAVVIFDIETKTAGMAHVALPDYRETSKKTTHENFELPGRYADTAIQELLRTIKEMGGTHQALRAKLAGGAKIFGSKGLLLGAVLNIGKRNTDRLIELLEQHNIPIVGEDLGGEDARTVTYKINSTQMIITNSSNETRRIL